MPTPEHRPQLSVLMGVRYQRKETTLLERAVNSILEQSFADLELLICQGGSTPEAERYLQETAQRDSRVRLLSARSPGTLAQNLNDCLAKAAGQFIARMDDDDRSHSWRLEKQVAFLREHPEISFVGCGASLIRGGEAIGVRTFPERPMPRDFYMTQPFLHPTLVFRREALEAAGGYSEGSRQVLCEDYDLLLRLYALGYQGANLQEVLFDYTLPATAKGNRTMGHRWNEAVTRYRRFKELDLLPGAMPWVVKPLAVGLLPEAVLAKVKEKRM